VGPLARSRRTAPTASNRAAASTPRCRERPLVPRSESSGAPGKAITGTFSIFPMAAVRPGSSAIPWAMTSPRLARAVIVASLRPTPLPPMVINISQSPLSSALATDCLSRPAALAQIVWVPAARAVSVISCAVAISPELAGISMMRRRGRRTLSRSKPAKRASNRSSGRIHRPEMKSPRELPSAMSSPFRRTPSPGLASATT